MPTPLKIRFTWETVPAAERGQRLDEHRRAWDLTRGELAERLHVSTATITSWNKGVIPPISKQKEIYAFLSEDPPDPIFTDAELAQLCQRIRDHRDAWNLTQTELGDVLEVSAGTIGRLERGYIPPRRLWERLANWSAKVPPRKRGTKATDLGRRLLAKRIRCGMTITEAAALFDVDVSVWRRWENGQRYPRDLRVAVLKWVEAPPERTLGQRVRENRMGLGMTQEDLAKALGVKKLAVRLWENNKAFPSPTNLKRVMAWLHANVRARPEINDYSALIKRMTDARQRLGISTARLVRILGVGKNSVRGWETGRFMPSEESRVKIVRWLNSLDEHYPTSSAA